MTSGALDMALEDVIRSKGGKRGGGGRANPKAGRAGGLLLRKGVRNGKMKVKNGGGAAAGAAREPGSGVARKTVLGRLPRFAKGLAATLNKAAKASAASVREGTDGATPKQPRAGPAVPKGPRALTVKLSMSLDDIAKGEGKKNQGRNARPGKAVGSKTGSPRQEKPQHQGGKRVAGRRRGQQQGVSKLRQDQQKVSSKTKQNGKAKPAGAVRMGKFAQRQQQAWQRDGRRGGAQAGGGFKGGKGKSKGSGKGWMDSWASPPRSHEGSWGHDGSWGGDGGWGRGGSPGGSWKGGMASNDQWGPRRADSHGGVYGWGPRGAADGYVEDFSGQGGSPRWGAPPPSSGKGGGSRGGWDGRDGGHDADIRRDSWGGGGGDSGSRNDSRSAALRQWDRQWGVSQPRSKVPAGPVSRTSTSSDSRNCRIKVCNVPVNLTRRDIKEAFEDSGTVVTCQVDRGTAWVTFANVMDAKKAMNTFDRGQLNGKTIYVTLE